MAFVLDEDISVFLNRVSGRSGPVGYQADTIKNTATVCGKNNSGELVFLSEIPLTLAYRERQIPLETGSENRLRLEVQIEKKDLQALAPYFQPDGSKWKSMFSLNLCKYPYSRGGVIETLLVNTRLVNTFHKSNKEKASIINEIGLGATTEAAIDTIESLGFDLWETDSDFYTAGFFSFSSEMDNEQRQLKNTGKIIGLCHNYKDCKDTILNEKGSVHSKTLTSEWIEQIGNGEFDVRSGFHRRLGFSPVQLSGETETKANDILDHSILQALSGPVRFNRWQGAKVSDLVKVIFKWNLYSFNRRSPQFVIGANVEDLPSQKEKDGIEDFVEACITGIERNVMDLFLGLTNRGKMDPDSVASTLGITKDKVISHLKSVWLKYEGQ